MILDMLFITQQTLNTLIYHEKDPQGLTIEEMVSYSLICNDEHSYI